KIDEFCHGDIGFLGRTVRVRADRAEHVRKTFGDAQDTVELPDAGADGDHEPHAGIRGAGQDPVEVAEKLREIEVAVAVDDERRRAAGERHAACSASTWRGTTGSGAGNASPGCSRPASPSRSKPRDSAGLASRSSSCDAEAGMNGWARMAS